MSVCASVRLCVCLFALQRQNYLADFNETFYKWFPIGQLSAFEFQLINIIDNVTAAVFKKKQKTKVLSRLQFLSDFLEIWYVSSISYY